MYLYELIEGYKETNDKEEKNKIFTEFMTAIWQSTNRRRHYQKPIKFKVREDLADTNIGKVFNKYSRVIYIGYRSQTEKDDWCSLIRQKINNLYVWHFDKEVILKKDYLDMLEKPRDLYYQWIKGKEMDINELDITLANYLKEAEELKTKYQKQKMDLSWAEYKKLVEGYLRRCFDNCKTTDEYEALHKDTVKISIYDFFIEDNFYISYICNSLESYLRNYQKEYYGLKRGRKKKYIRCAECGDLIEKTNNRVKYCKECAKKINVQKQRDRDKKKILI